jgi:hypothetical protein
MHTFVSFMFDDAAISHWVKPEWFKFLDRSYVEGTLVASLNKYRPAAERWLDARRFVRRGHSVQICIVE